MPSPTYSPQQIEEAARLIAGLQRERTTARVTAIESACAEILGHLDAWGDRLRSQLEEQLAALEVGCPPSFIRVAGQSRLEKPFNRLLAWMVDPDGDHGWGKLFLRLLAEKLDLPEMVADLDNLPGGRLEIRAEVRLDGDDSGRMPDLAIRTTHAALLLENKVWAPESGDDQYASYLALFCNWAGDRERRAVLCAREDRDVPPDWNHFVPHRELANLLACLAEERLDLSIWSRICAALCAEALRDRDLVSTVRSAREIRRSRPGEHPSSLLEQISALRKLLPLPRPITPWTTRE